METARCQRKKFHRFFLDLFTKNTVQAQAALYRNPPDATSQAANKPPRAKPS